MSAERLREIRGRMGLTQAEMARRIGISLRAYLTAEGGKTRRIYVLAVEMAALMEAYERGDPGMLPDDLGASYAAYGPEMMRAVCERAKARVSG